ncbi:MAG: energy transducer TonB [Porticoccaceae bacterium]
MAIDVSFPQTFNNHDNDRLGFAMLVALAIHVMLIFGVGFKLAQQAPSAQSMEITVALRRSQVEPDEADYLAQVNQAGSGEQREKQEITTDQMPEFNDSVWRETEVPAPPEPAQIMGEQQLAPVLTTSSDSVETSPDRVLPKEIEATAEEFQPLSSAAQEIASLRARLDRSRQHYAKMPKVLRLTSVSTKAADHAAYLNYWVARVEEAGNLNYPEEARLNRIFGDLRVVVVLLPDGSVEDIEIRQSSGQRVLDQAAIRTIRLASPFSAFPPEMSQFDKIEIIRTWHFVPGNRIETR